MQGRDIRQLREAAELRLVDVANELGCRIQSVHDVEESLRVRRSTSQRYCKAIATAMRRKRISDILDGASIAELSAS